MVHLRPNEIVVTIQTQDPVADLFSIQNALLAMIQNVDPVQLDSSRNPIYHYIELLRNFQPDERQLRALLMV